MSKQKEKEWSAAEFDKWVDGEIDDVLKDIPEAHQKLAKTDEDMLRIIAERVARKKGFNIQEVTRLLKTKFDGKE